MVLFRIMRFLLYKLPSLQLLWFPFIVIYVSFVDLGLYIMYLLCLKALIILGYFAISFVLNEIILTLTYTSAEVLVMVILKPANTAFFPTFF